MLNLIPYKLYLIPNPFSDIKIIAYEIELPPAGNKIGVNLLDDEDFTIPSIIYTIPNSPDINRLTTQANKNVCIISINGENSIRSQGALDELKCNQTKCGKSKVKISICRSKNYPSTYIEEI